MENTGSIYTGKLNLKKYLVNIFITTYQNTHEVCMSRQINSKLNVIFSNDHGVGCVSYQFERKYSQSLYSN